MHTKKLYVKISAIGVRCVILEPLLFGLVSAVDFAEVIRSPIDIAGVDDKALANVIVIARC